VKCEVSEYEDALAYLHILEDTLQKSSCNAQQRIGGGKESSHCLPYHLVLIKLYCLLKTGEYDKCLEFCKERGTERRDDEVWVTVYAADAQWNIYRKFLKGKGDINDDKRLAILDTLWKCYNTLKSGNSRKRFRYTENKNDDRIENSNAKRIDSTRVRGGLQFGKRSLLWVVENNLAIMMVSGGDGFEGMWSWE
tara:strand:+ start:670 stop:1251 length:582 start_codon:yes stop_codon:yes gene_type:complete